jgi:hypothetical protein
MRLTPEEIKAKTPRISRICQECAILCWGRRSDTTGAEMLYNASSARLFRSAESVAFLFFSPIRSESGGRLLNRNSDWTHN